MPQFAITHSGSNSSALRKHFTPSSTLKPKTQLRPRSNQRWASHEGVEMGQRWLPRLKRSMSAVFASRDCWLRASLKDGVNAADARRYLDGQSTSGNTKAKRAYFS